MADSMTTKKILAASMKELIEEMPFTKITISDIAGRSNMSRKSFYYHFKDKYDLVNWIFENEFVVPVQERERERGNTSDDRWNITLELCEYFYNNKSFYSKIIKVKGQNCFSEYFKELIRPIIEDRIKTVSDDSELIAFCGEIYSDGALSAMEKWILDKNAVRPEEFLRLLKGCIKISSTANI